jgi:hypothetical protein
LEVARIKLRDMDAGEEHTVAMDDLPGEIARHIS